MARFQRLLDEVSRSGWLQRVLVVVLSGFYSVLPRDRRMICFESFPDCSESSWVMFTHIMASANMRRYRLCWLANNVEQTESTIRRNFPGTLPIVRVVQKDSLAGELIFLRSRWVFSSHKTYRYARPASGQCFVNLWHGMPLKNIGSYDGRPSLGSKSDVYSIATSDFFADIIAQAFHLKRERVLPCGLPRNEWLFECDEKHRAVRGMAASMVSWLPTYRKTLLPEHSRSDSSESASDPMTVEQLALLDDKLEGANVRLVVKLHPLDVKNAQLWPEFRNLVVFTDAKMRADGLDVYRLLACSDALVTDYSSVAMDYLLLRRPVGFYAPDEEFYTRGFIEPVRSRIAGIGTRIRTLDDLAAFLRNPGVLHGEASTLEELCNSQAVDPSRTILRVVGLDDLADA